MRFAILFSILIHLAFLAEAAPQKFESETQVTASPETKFTISAGWSFDSDTKKISSPEADLIIYLFEQKTQKDFAALAKTLWKSVNPKFNYPVHQSVTPPPHDGWYAVHQVTYETPAKENKFVAAISREFRGKSYILLIDSSRAALSKRGAQLELIISTWAPAELQKEDLSKNSVNTFTDSMASDMDRLIKKSMQELKVPGASVGIIQDGKLVYRKAFGVKSLASKEAVTPETLFMIGSTTKPLTTLMISKLVEDKKLTWETPLQKALPSFKLSDPATTSQVQMKHTACACTGMPRRDMDFVFGSLIQTSEDAVNQMQTMKPTTGFGETFQYSNSLVAAGGYAAGHVYNKGSDLFSKYENAMTDLVFKPLEMNATRIKVTSQDNVASPHARDLNGLPTLFSQSVDDMVYPIAPAGSAWSHVDDLSKYVLMELRKGKSASGKTLFSEAEIIRRRSPGVKVGDNVSYGLGLFSEKNYGVTVIGHGGNTMGFTHDLLFLPDYGIGMIVQTNLGSANVFTDILRANLFELLLNAHPQADKTLNYAKKRIEESRLEIKERFHTKPKDNQWINQFVGTYKNPYLGEIKIERNKSQFKLITKRWASDLATAKEKSGEKLLALVSSPWSGLELRANGKSKTLTLDDDQISYEFTEVK